MPLPAFLLTHLCAPACLSADVPLCPCLQNNRGLTSLGIAVGFNKLPVIELLLEKGADVMLTDAAGNTVLHYAAGELAALQGCLPPPVVVRCTDAMAPLSTVHSCGCISSGSSQAMTGNDIRACLLRGKGVAWLVPSSLLQCH